jgi:exosortase/archaeosortase family protein
MRDGWSNRYPGSAFALRLGAWIVGLFGVLRSTWVQTWILVPFGSLQGEIACRVMGAPRGAVVVDRSCTGYDALALCLGAIFAFPAPWRKKAGGAAVGFALITLLNTLRIGTLAMVAGKGRAFEILHLYVWPAVIVIAAAGYVFAWMRWVDGGSRLPLLASGRLLAPSARRFLGLTVLLVILYYAVSPWLLDSKALLVAARWAAATAGGLMTFFGASVEVTDNFLRTDHGTWVVTQECVATPLVAVYLAAALAFLGSTSRRLVACLSAPPLFLGLATARLLVLAIPATLVASQNVAVHAFHQMVTGLVLVIVAAHLARGPGRVRRWSPLPGGAVALAGGSLLGLAWGLVDLRLVRPAAEVAVAWLPHLGHSWVDAQGALALLPGYQMGLLAALWLAIAAPISDRWLLGGGVALLAVQIIAIVGAGEIATHLDLEVPTIAIRALAVLGPVAVVAAAIARNRGGWKLPTSRPGKVTRSRSAG